MKNMWIFAGCFLLLSIIASGLYADTAQTMRLLVIEGKAQEAFDIGQKDQLQESGDEAFDMAYADAAFKSDHWSEAIFALERILISKATNHTARLLQARCYIKLKDFQLARSSLAIIQASKAPAPIKQAAEALRETIEKLTQVDQDMKFSLHNELAAGYSSNPSLLPGLDIYSVLADQPKRLKGIKTAWPDSFGNYALSASLTNELSDGVKNSLRLKSKYRKYLSNLTNDSISLGLTDEFRFDISDFTFTTPVGGSLTFLNYKLAVATIDLNAKVSAAVTPMFSIAALSGFNRTMFIGNTKKNFHRVLAAFEIKFTIPETDLSISGQGFYHFGFALPDSKSFLVKDSSGGLLTLSYKGLPDQHIGVEALLEDKNYKNINPKFGVVRHDIAVSAKAKWSWSFAPNWMLEPSYRFAISTGNIPEYGNTLHEVMASISYNWLI